MQHVRIFQEVGCFSASRRGIWYAEFVVGGAGRRGNGLVGMEKVALPMEKKS